MTSLLGSVVSVVIVQYAFVQGTKEVSLVNTFTTQADASEYKYFTCYVSDSDSSGVTVESRRVSDTQTTGRIGNNRPPNVPTMGDGGYRIYLSNILNGAFGVFACDVSRANGDATSVQTILLKSTAHIVPRNKLLTVTVNKGDPQIVLEMDERVSNENEAIWRKDGGLALSSFTFSLNVPVSGGTITTSDAGVYECHHNKRRDSAVHGLQRLIVRACSADHWGPPDCFGICDNCYNGGICDDTTGECICPAGFQGPNCLSACGPTRHFGTNCEYSCPGISENRLYCRGSMVCLPDPFGCRCTTGFKGLDCSTTCIFPNFGANCLETCHCANGAGCNRYTGVCNNGRCGGGYTGDNCQIPPTCKQGYYGSECLMKCHCKNNAACDRVTGRCDQGCANGFTVPQDAENCEACNIGFFGNDCEYECHCTGECHNVNGTCDPSSCKTPWINWRPEPCQTGIANITVAKVNPGALVQVTCTVQSRNFLSSVTAFLSKSERYQPSNDITPVRTRTISATSKTREFIVSNVVTEDVFYCFLGYTGGVTNAERYYRGKAAEFYVLPELSSPPQLVTLSNTSVSISWRAWNEEYDRGDPPVIGYVAYHRKKNASDWMRGVVDYSSSLSEQFDSLESDTVYQFSVVAIRNGSFGEGPKSPSLSVKTNCWPFIAPGAPPFNIQARLIEGKGNNVNISWEVPENIAPHCSSAGRVTGFIIYVHGLDVLHTEILDNTNHSWYIVKGLAGEKNYSFQVKLITEGGESLLSEQSQTSTVFVPAAIIDLHDENEGTSSSLLLLPIVLLSVVLLAVIVTIVVIKRHLRAAANRQTQDANNTNNMDDVYEEPNDPNYLPLNEGGSSTNQHNYQDLKVKGMTAAPLDVQEQHQNSNEYDTTIFDDSQNKCLQPSANTVEEDESRYEAPDDLKGSPQTYINVIKSDN